jgi:hypothetical protein
MLIVKGLSVERIDPDCGAMSRQLPPISFVAVSSAIVQQPVAQLQGNEMEEFEADPPRLSPGPIGYKNLVSNWCQTAPYLPVLPIQPAYNYLSVNNLRFIRFHGMEEVIGSIPIRSTKSFQVFSATSFPNTLSQIPRPSLRKIVAPSLLKPQSAPFLF